MPRGFIAIAAMAENRVIGAHNKLPWHLPEELRWFKKITTGHVLVMGRKTFESIGKPLPNRETIVVSRSGFSFPGVKVVASLAEVDPSGDSRHYFLIGGEQIFREGLPLCSELYLTHVKRIVEGDVFFPPFEDIFEPRETVMETPEFRIMRYINIGGADRLRAQD